MSEIKQLLSFIDSHPHEKFAMATVVRTQGSTYRKSGARIVITQNGKISGALSGGCLEKDIAKHAIAVINSGKPRLISYDTRLTLGCNGCVEIFVENLSAENPCLDQLRRKMAARKPTVLATCFVSDSPERLGTCACDENHHSESWRNANNEVLYSKHSAHHVLDQTTEVLFSYVPSPIRLLIVGASHDAVPLSRIAENVNWDVQFIVHPQTPTIDESIVDDPRLRMLSPENLKLELQADVSTAIIVMTHHFARDLAYLHALLEVNVPYLGLLGPLRRREQLFAALLDQSFDINPETLNAFANVRSPVGLDLGGETPEEIALSIVAEISSVLAGRTGTPLKLKKCDIHDEAHHDFELTRSQIQFLKTIAYDPLT